MFGHLNPMRMLGHFSPMLMLDDSGMGSGGAGGAGGTATAEPPPAAEGAEGKTTSWMDVLPEDARKDPSVTKYKTADEFYKGYKNTLDIVGRKGVIVPKPDAPKEEQEKFLNALGRPEKPEGYKFKAPEKLHPNVQVTPEMEAGMKALFHQRGIPQAQADALYNDFLTSLSASNFKKDEQLTEQTKKAETALRDKWGKDYDSNITRATKFVERMGGKEALDAFNNSGAGRDPKVLEVLAKAGKMMSEDSIGKIGFSTMETSKQEALRRIQEMNNDLKGPLYNENDPKHRMAREERNKLYEIAYGEEQ